MGVTKENEEKIAPGIERETPGIERDSGVVE